MPGVPRGVEQPERVRLRRSLAEERGRRADPAEVATAEDDPRHRGSAAAEESLVHPTDPTAAGPRTRPGSDQLGSRQRPRREEEVAADVIRCRRRPLRPDALQPLRPQRARAARDLARALAELRGHHSARDEPGDRASRVRSRRHPLRPREQLRPAVRLGGGELRPDHAGRPPALPRRARDLDQGRLRHVARPLRRRRLAQVPSREPRPEPRAARPRLRRHLLLASRSTRRRRSRRRWARSTAPCGRARRSTPASRPTRPRRPGRRTRSSAISARRS